jgi:ubiquitin C-terminal hydrolase
LQKFFVPETIEGYKDAKKNEVPASRHTTIERLPRVLIFHLKRFEFKGEGTSKVSGHVSFPVELQLRQQYFARTTNANERKYKLLTVVTHIGSHATNGHYVCDIRQRGGDWIHFDDSTVYKTTLDQVENREAYLLFYEQVL